MSLQEQIESSWSGEVNKAAVEQVIAQLDKGELRVAEKIAGEWMVHDWIKKAILLYFRTAGMKVHEVGAYEFYDKIPLKKDLAAIHAETDEVKRGTLARTLRLETMVALREKVDELEGIVPADLWTLATYKELMFLDQTHMDGY